MGKSNACFSLRLLKESKGLIYGTRRNFRIGFPPPTLLGDGKGQLQTENNLKHWRSRMKFFTHYWSLDQNDIEGAVSTPTPLDHTVGSQFRQREVGVGDIVYVISVKRGTFYLIGKLSVGEILSSDKEAKDRLRYKPWSGPEHLIASRCTPVQLVPLPVKVVERLRFESTSGSLYPKFVSRGVLDRQTVRGVRRLYPDSAAELDRFLPKMEPFSPKKKSFWRRIHS
jgi:hypothetical protein